MKRLLLVTGLFLCLSLGSCQCSNKPDVGPVENASTVSTPATTNLA